MSKPKVLHIINTLGVGGAEKLLAGIVSSMDGYEHHVMILKAPEQMRSEMTGVYRFTNLECNSYNRLFLKIGKVRKYIRREKIDIVHSHLLESNLLARWAAPKSVGVINSIHAIPSLASYKTNKAGLYLERLSYKKRHIVVAVSNEVLEDYKKWVGLKGPFHVLYNYIEDKFFQPLRINGSFSKRDELKLVAVGNLRYQKNYPYLIEAFKQLPKNISLDIYGEGSMRGDLQQVVDQHGLNIRLCGLHTNLEEFLPRYDAFVMSSFYEGQPVSLLEAIASGLPAVLADIPVLREVTGNNAIYFDTSDPKSFIEAINGMLNDKYDLRAMTMANLQKINSFARKKQYLDKLRDIYREATRV